MDQNNDTFLILNCLENAIDSLETAVSFIYRSDCYRWKWLVISLHHSFYMFMIAALENGNPDNVEAFKSDGAGDRNQYIKFDNSPILRSSTQKIGKGPAYRIIWNQADSFPQKANSIEPSNYPKLINFWSALARIQDDCFWMHRSIDTKALQLTEKQLEDIQWVTLKLRNEFVHFLPKGYLMDTKEIQSALVTFVNAISFIAFESASLLWFKEEWYNQTKEAIHTLSKNLSIAK